MLRVLTLATLFPHRAQPTLGVFVERQTRAFAGRLGVAVEVAAPVGLPVWPLSRHPHYAPLTALPEQESWNGLSVHRPRFRIWPRVGAAMTAAAMAGALLPLLRSLRVRFPFDAIDAEYFWPDGVAAMHLADALGVPFSVKARGSDIYHWGDRPGIAAQIRAAAAAADGLLAVSASLKEEMVRRGLPGERIRVHHTGVDLDRFRPGAAGTGPRREGGPVLVCAGALIPRKGQAFAIEVVAALPDATLLLVGDGPDRAKLERLARALGVAERVRFLGARPHAELPALLGAADLLLLPTAAEGLANVWVEALACGTPVVTCDAGAAREVIDRPAAGRVVAREPAALAAAVREILADPPARDEVRKAAERFSWDRNAAELHEHLAGIAEGRSAPKAA